jgi:glycosyltransferase involved in cell wall biosynthesis
MSSYSSKVTLVIPFADDAWILPPLLSRLEEEPYPILFIALEKYTHETLQLIVDFISKRETLPTEVIIDGDVTYKGQAYNLAMRHATTPYLLLLQPKMFPIEPLWIERLVDRLESHSKIAAVAPMCTNEMDLVEHSGCVYLRGIPTPADQRVPKDWGMAGNLNDFLSLTDDCLLIRRVRLFDVVLKGAYHEHDWCLWNIKDGYRLVYDPCVKIQLRWTPKSEDSLRDLGHFVDKHGGLHIVDQFNNAGSYYGSGPSYPSTEQWVFKPESGITPNGRVCCFLADHDGCGTYRLKKPYRKMMSMGWEMLFTTYAPDEFMMWADVIVYQRQVEDYMIDLLRKGHIRKKLFIYEIDDFFHGLTDTNPVQRGFAENPRWLRNMEKMIYMCQALTVSTPELARQYGRFNKNTHVVPNCIDLQRLPTILENHDDTVRIGWAGSGTHDADMKLAVNAMHKIMAEFPQCVLVFIGADYRSYFPEVPFNRMEWYPATWGHEEPVFDYYKVLNMARLDIGLAPIENTLFNRCKSDIKLVEYGAFGIVPVASDVEPYALFEAEGRPRGQKLAFLARSEADWYRHLKRLVEDPQLRHDVASAAQAYVWHSRGIEHMAQQLEQIIGGLLTGDAHYPQRPEPIHSLNIPFLNNLTSKQATELFARPDIQKAMAAAR